MIDDENVPVVGDQEQQEQIEDASGGLENSLPEPNKSNRSRWTIVIVGALVICLCSIVGVVLIAGGLSRVENEKAPVESVLDEFMNAMLVEDTVKAYALYSPRAQRQISVSDLEELLNGNNFVIIEGYRHLEIGNLKILATRNTNDNLPQGTVAEVSGVVFYEDNFSGKFDATLEKVDGEWLLHFINIVVPPNKLTQ